MSHQMELPAGLERQLFQAEDNLLANLPSDTIITRTQGGQWVARR